MVVQCRMVSEEEGKRGKPGDMFYVPHMLDGDYTSWYLNHYLSLEYLRDWKDKRPPIIVICPDGTPWCIDSRASEEEHGWTITGEPPNLTAHPSINIVGSYHGWLRNGEFSDA